jgi:exopolyphosphatase/guanosine-5'-triphosphate,3'-diphosphate pyrophosphatase
MHAEATLLTRAVISLGTNSTRLLVVRDRAGGRVEQLEHDSTGTRLGEGLQGSGLLEEAAMRRTLDAVERYAERVHELGASVAGIATSAMRRASNAPAFTARVETLIGAPLRILDGREEAACSFAGATYEDGAAGRQIAVVDVGGGSAECAVGRDGVLGDDVSVEIGAVRLGERFPELMGSAPREAANAAAVAARADAAHSLAPFARFVPVDEVRVVGGTATTLGAIVFAADVESVAGRTLARAEIDALVDRMLALDLTQRRALPGMIAQRADILAAGAIVISEALRRLDADEARVETNDLLLGYLLRTGPSQANR